SITAGFNFGYLTQPPDFIVPGSDRILGGVDVGFSTILWKRTLLNVTGQFGLTGHVTDFRLIASVRVRFYASSPFCDVEAPLPAGPSRDPSLKRRTPPGWLARLHPSGLVTPRAHSRCLNPKLLF